MRSIPSFLSHYHRWAAQFEMLSFHLLDLSSSVMVTCCFSCESKEHYPLSASKFQLTAVIQSRKRPLKSSAGVLRSVSGAVSLKVVVRFVAVAVAVDAAAYAVKVKVIAVPGAAVVV